MTISTVRFTLIKHHMTISTVRFTLINDFRLCFGASLCQLVIVVVVGASLSWFMADVHRTIGHTRHHASVVFPFHVFHVWSY